MTDAVFNPELLREDVELEAKLAGGRDGKGGLPDDLWETYSAFANTDGGVILLGVKEGSDGELVSVGIEKPDRVLEQFWNQINNPQKVSRNLLQSSDVVQHPAGNGKWVISLVVPRAPRSAQPVFINGNPLRGTFKRLHTGDYRCPEEQVNRMLAEQAQDARDARILKGFSFDDIDMESFKAYRNHLAALKPDHPFNNSDHLGFMKQIGGWARDRETDVEGLTLAGLLMFGKQVSIQEAVRHYFVDYRELPVSGTKTQWVDRITPDGTWSGNLYDFYRRTIKKLFQDIKVPFKLAGQEREDDTPVHKAIREALVNTIIHADYAAPVSILVVKAPDYFGFRNPGRMRIPINKAFEGGHSDSRNRYLQKMFSLINLGEQAGSGIPRVVENWKTQHYRMPELWENDEPESTLMRLRTVSLLPEITMRELEEQFGPAFKELSDNERLALATARIEGFVSNVRLQQICRLHPSDITLLLKKLVSGEYLTADGQGRATTYRVAGSDPLDLSKAFTLLEGLGSSSAGKGSSSIGKGASSIGKGSSSIGKGSSSIDKEQKSIGKGSAHSSECLEEELLRVAEVIRAKRRAKPSEVMNTILDLCRGRFLTLNDLGRYLGRSPVDLRNRYVKKLVESKQVVRQYPQQPNHEKQAYRTVDWDNE